MGHHGKREQPRAYGGRRRAPEAPDTLRPVSRRRTRHGRELFHVSVG
ncbi:hypothetical protein STTU_0487 [Streptomyces sp. Tu6071]|nr:hypothetical protein STTU_0487 [Streptomyces sp. Tu6071]